MPKDVDRLREAMAALVTPAHQQEAAAAATVGSRRGDDRPAAWARRAARLATLEAAMRRLAPRAKAAAEAARQRRAEAEAERQPMGARRRGKAPQPVEAIPDDQAQTPCTTPALQSLPTKHKGWEDGGHAPARVEAASPIIVACDVTVESHDTQQAAPMAPLTMGQLEQAGLGRPPDAPGAVHKMPAPSDRGSDREAAGMAVEPEGVAPSMATGRQRHQPSQAEGAEPPSTAKDRLAAKGQTPTGRAWSARRPGIVAPVCGQSKAARGGRRFLRRGVQHIRGAWGRVCLTQQVLKMWRHECAPITGEPQERASDGLAMAISGPQASWEALVAVQADVVSPGTDLCTQEPHACPGGIRGAYVHSQTASSDDFVRSAWGGNASFGWMR